MLWCIIIYVDRLALLMRRKAWPTCVCILQPRMQECSRKWTVEYWLQQDELIAHTAQNSLCPRTFFFNKSLSIIFVVVHRKCYNLSLCSLVSDLKFYVKMLMFLPRLRGIFLLKMYVLYTYSSLSLLIFFYSLICWPEIPPEENCTHFYVFTRFAD